MHDFVLGCMARITVDSIGCERPTCATLPAYVQSIWLAPLPMMYFILPFWAFLTVVGTCATGRQRGTHNEGTQRGKGRCAGHGTASALRSPRCAVQLPLAGFLNGIPSSSSSSSRSGYSVTATTSTTATAATTSRAATTATRARAP